MPLTAAQRSARSRKAAATRKKNAGKTGKTTERMPKHVVTVEVELPSKSYAQGRHGFDRVSGGTFKLKREGKDVEVRAPCGDRVAKFSMAALKAGVDLVAQDVEVMEKAT